MHPFGGVPICPRCDKAVYAAEQVMGPGRNLYHKLCLTCTTCNKRLDSTSLVEHDREPYCNHCHKKNFGPRDLRQANLPHRDAFPALASPSPIKAGSPSKVSPISPSWQHRSLSSPPPIFKKVSDSVKEMEDRSLTEETPERRRATPAGAGATAPSPQRSMSDDPSKRSSYDPGRWRSSSPIFVDVPDDKANGMQHHDDDDAEDEDEDERRFGDLPPQPQRIASPRTTNSYSPYSPSITATTTTTIHRSASPTRSALPSFSAARAMDANFTGPPSPLRPTMTGTRYGAALTGNLTGTPLNLNGPLSPTRNLNFAAANGRPGSPIKPVPLLVNSPLSPTKTGGGAWGAGTPRCAKCTRPVYFAEQVKASGKTFHKPCLKCSECNTALDSTKLAEKDGQIVCRSCYGKLYGPRGSGYALLGKAGG